MTQYAYTTAEVDALCAALEIAVETLKRETDPLPTDAELLERIQGIERRIIDLARHAKAPAY